MSNYNTWNNYKFLYPFEGSDTVTATYSQAWQDIFVLTMLSGLKNGTYLEVGCNIPDYTNNTYLLSKDFNWNGTSIDFLPNVANAWKTQRPENKLLIADALTLDYAQLLQDNTVIDYLQLDIEPSTNTFSVLTKLPHNTHRFKVITFETDYYTGGDSIRVREESRKFLTDLGYTMIIGDVLVDGNKPFEDWYVDMNLVNQTVAKSIKEKALHTQNPQELLVCPK